MSKISDRMKKVIFSTSLVGSGRVRPAADTERVGGNERTEPILIVISFPHWRTRHV